MTLSLSRIFFFFYIEKIIAQNFKIYLPVEIKRIIKYLHEMKGEALEKSMQKKKPVSLELCALSLSRNMQEREKKEGRIDFEYFLQLDCLRLKKKKKKEALLVWNTIMEL